MSEREYRALTTLQRNEEDSYIVEGYATTFKKYELYELNEIKYYEQIDSKAFDEADMSDVIMQYDHKGKVFARQSNGTLEIIPDEHGLFIRADLSKSAGAKELYEEIKAGLITKMSWAFTIKEHGYDIETRTRTILKVKKIYDVSAVSIPANEDTTISARSFINGEIEKVKREALVHELEAYKLQQEILKEI